MPLDLDDDEKAALIELLAHEVRSSRCPLAPRTKALRRVLEKLSVGSPRPAPHPPRNRPANRAHCSPKKAAAALMPMLTLRRPLSR